MEKQANNDHEMTALIRNRWSPRAFADRDVGVDIVRSVLEAARWAASAFNEQPWRYLVAMRQNPVQHRQMVDCLVEGNQSWAQHAPVLLLTLARTSYTKNGKPNAHAWHDVGAASTTLALEACAHGLQAHQMAGIHAKHIREIYRVPEGFEPVTGIALGYPGSPETLSPQLATMETAPRTRKPQSEIVFMETWGTPFEP